MIARRVIFFFLYFLNIGKRSISKSSFYNLVRKYYRLFNVKWLKVIKKRPYISVYAFIKYYIKLLVVCGFDKRSQGALRLHREGFLSTFSSFFSILDKLLHFWRVRQNFFRLAVIRRKVVLKFNRRRFLKPTAVVDRFCERLFLIFYRNYLLNFRQSKFFRFMSFLVDPIFANIGLIGTEVEFFGIDNNTVTASFLARYLARKMEMRFGLRELFTPIARELRFLVRNTSALLGYKVQFVGRLTRRGHVRTS